ncbi:hypothetical protein M8E35_13690 [Desulfosporosinus nitroreducens]|nr:hypothetical protein [Desulfosporosinus nitroreducens]
MGTDSLDSGDHDKLHRALKKSTYTDDALGGAIGTGILWIRGFNSSSVFT